MKSEFTVKIFTHISIRLLLTSAVICVFTFGIGSFIADMGLRIIISIPFVAAICLYTSMTIVRHLKYLMAAQFDMLHESAEMLKMASMSLADIAKGVYLNTHIMKGAAGTILGNTGTHREALNNESNPKTIEKQE